MPFALDDALVVERVNFAVGDNFLEGELTYADGASIRTGVVIAGPHPLLGGDMSNNVVRGLAIGLARRRYATLAFNYGSAGGSDRSRLGAARHAAAFWAASHVPDESNYADDLIGAVAFLQDALAESPAALIGYSFGCSLLPGAAPNAKVPLVLVAPTVGHHDYDAFAEITNPLLVIAPDGDFAANSTTLRRWYDGLIAPRRLIHGDWDAHFFRGHEARLCEAVFAFLNEE